jgi:hypothetical protein
LPRYPLPEESLDDRPAAGVALFAELGATPDELPVRDDNAADLLHEADGTLLSIVGKFGPLGPLGRDLIGRVVRELGDRGGHATVDASNGFRGSAPIRECIRRA